MLFGTGLHPNKQYDCHFQTLLCTPPSLALIVTDKLSSTNLNVLQEAVFSLYYNALHNDLTTTFITALAFFLRMG